MKSPAGKGEFSGLVHQRLHDPRVAMTLVDGGISAQEIIVLFPIHITDINTLTALQHDGNRMIVMRTVLLFERQVVGGF